MFDWLEVTFILMIITGVLGAGAAAIALISLLKASDETKEEK